VIAPLARSNPAEIEGDDSNKNTHTQARHPQNKNTKLLPQQHRNAGSTLPVLLAQ